MDVNGQAAEAAELLPANRFKDVVVLIEVIPVHHQGFYREFADLQMLLEHLATTTQPIENGVRNEGYFPGIH